MTSCAIIFENNPHKVIYAGQSLRGNAFLTLTEEKTIRGVYIRIKGKAFCSWKEGFKDNETTYMNRETYLNEKTYLFGDSFDEIQLMPGTYNYAFQCLLPRNLPTSVEGREGYIRYTICVGLDIPMGLDKKFKVPFTVIRAVNLSAIPTLREPVVEEKNISFSYCCLMCCFTSNSLKMVVRTPAGGYAPGQIINLVADIDNRSHVNVNNFSVKLIKEITYLSCSSRHRKLETHVISQHNLLQSCKVNELKTFCMNIEVPSIPPSDIDNKTIQVRYLIRTGGVVTGCHIDPVVDLPITIGSYPIQDNFILSNQYATTIPTNSVITVQPMAPPLPQTEDPTSDSMRKYSTQSRASTELFPFFNENPPTYYEAAEHLKDQGDEQFKPKYGMFKHTTSYSKTNSNLN